MHLLSDNMATGNCHVNCAHYICMLYFFEYATGCCSLSAYSVISFSVVHFVSKTSQQILKILSPAHSAEKFGTKLLLNILPHQKHVAILPCEIYIF